MGLSVRTWALHHSGRPVGCSPLLLCPPPLPPVSCPRAPALGSWEDSQAGRTGHERGRELTILLGSLSQSCLRRTAACSTSSPWWKRSLGGTPSCPSWATAATAGWGAAACPWMRWTGRSREAGLLSELGGDSPGQTVQSPSGGRRPFPQGGLFDEFVTRSLTFDLCSPQPSGTLPIFHFQGPGFGGIKFSSVQSLSRVRLFAAPSTAAR